MKMELRNNHNIQLCVNGEIVDISDVGGLNIRFNSVLANPTSISSTNGEYSFSFTLPKTPKNQRIFGYANILSKPNKFSHSFNATFEVDGLLIFSGNLLINKINKEGYSCNLYLNKQNTVESIFGEMMMNELDWKVDYNGATTINEMGGDIDLLKYGYRDYTFPLISYGCFQKMSSGDTFTSKYVIDDSTKIYQENLYPSFNLLGLVRKLFEQKGYDVQGDVFDDDTLGHIFTSTKLADKQNPTYNYGTDMGKCTVTFDFSNKVYDDEGNESLVQPVQVALDRALYPTKNTTDDITYYNWEYNNIYDLFVGKNANVSADNKLLFRENRLVALESGWYKIGMSIQYGIDSFSENTKFNRKLKFNGKEYTITSNDNDWTFREFPVEFQLVKNSNDNLDVRMITPDATQSLTNFAYLNGALTVVANTRNDPSEVIAYPHEANRSYIMQHNQRNLYMPKNGNTLMYDPSVNPNFVMGCATSGEYTLTSVIKNGKSWNKECTDEGKGRYISNDYNSAIVNHNRIYVIGTTDKRTNTLPNGTMNLVRNEVGSNRDFTASCNMTAIVYLEKNDFLQLKMLQRRWINADEDVESNDTYQTDAIVQCGGIVTFEMFAPYDKLSVNDDYMNWNNESLFDKQLNLGNFLPSDEKVSDFINNFLTEFNLSYSENDNIVTLNKQVIDYERKPSINLSDRLHEDEIEIEKIDFPKELSVKYTINEEERGVYLTANENATDAQMQQSNWKDFADKGYDIVQIDSNGTKDSNISTKTSYCWYDNFRITQDGQNKQIKMPIIAKDEWLIDNHKMEESMKYDGYNLPRRYFFPQSTTSSYVYLNGDKNQKVYITTVSDIYSNENGEITEMSYKYNSNNETLLTRYFNVFVDTSSNYINFEVYLTTQEYLQLKNGANIVINSDVYIPIEIEGYDPSGKNKTQIKAMRK